MRSKRSYNEAEAPKYKIPTDSQPSETLRKLKEQLAFSEQADEIKSLIQARVTVDNLLKVAVEQGMATLLRDGVLKSIRGWTDFKQVKAVAMI